MTDHSSPENAALMGKSLAEAHRLLQESGYNFEEAHPECYRNFSYAKLFQLIEADRIRAQQMPDAIAMAREALKPFALDVGAVSLSKALGHISREHLLAARDALAALTSPECPPRTCATCHAVLADGPQPAATYSVEPQQMPADYAAWLVEINDTTDGPEYFHLSDDDDWIKDHDKALHFARQADADRVIEYYGWTRAKAVEHMWPSHTRPECGDEQ